MPTLLDRVLAVSDPDDRVRLLATQRLRRDSDYAVCEILAQALEDRSWVVRASAAYGLGLRRAPEGLEGLLRHARCDEHPEVRAACTGVLRDFKDPRVPTVLIEALADPDWTVIVAACAGLEIINAHEAVSPLLALLEHPETIVRCFAVSALLGLGIADQRMFSIISCMLEHPDDHPEPGLCRELQGYRDARPVEASLKATTLRRLLTAGQPEKENENEKEND